uniref:A disintegrin and metallopeptidase domain 32 n=1 Tax=Nannospalax galili TaxID=1026970 RepID=A0A8C6R9A0_NANGA
MPRPPLLPPLQLLLAGLWALASEPGSQNSFLQIIFPEKMKGNTSSEEQISYIIPIDEKPYTVHLQKRYFLADHFMVYLYNQGSINYHASASPAQCYYQGYVEGYPNSVVTLSTCSGLRGILQFENVSYGIEPLESAIIFQHIVYKLGNEDNALANLNKNSRSIADPPLDYGILIDGRSEQPLPVLYPLFIEMSIVVDKDLCDYLGSDSRILTNKIIEIISLVNSMFSQLKVTIVLSSLELWSDENKISTAGEPDDLLRRFLEWRKGFLTLRPHDIAYLFKYNENLEYMGATFPGKMCVTSHSAGIAVYLKGMTLETFAVIVTQMLGLSLGISHDDPVKCHCPAAVCVMNPKTMQTSGRKIFSNCSLNDFQNFILNVGAKCLQNKPQFQVSPRPFCGNGIVEGKEACDCGNKNQCGPDSCCDPQSCVLKPGKECDSQSPTSTCCEACKFLAKGQECRPAKHRECDIPEFCNGSTARCPPDITIQDGNMCKKNSFFCYDGDCHDLDARCEHHFGKGSKKAPFSCYEEIQSQTDRFGNCGKDSHNRFIFCGWRNLICGKLICTYPRRTPYISKFKSSSVIYAFVRNKTCVSVDVGSITDDPFMVKSGPICDIDRICINSVCVESRHIKAISAECSKKCSGHGVCDSLGTCRCEAGYEPLTMQRASRKAEKKWLPGLYIALSVLIAATLVVVAWSSLKSWLPQEEGSLRSKSKSQGSHESHSS